VKNTDYQKAIELGINKISIFTRASSAAVNSIIEAVAKSRPRFPELLAEAKNGMCQEVTLLMQLFQSNNRA